MKDKPSGTHPSPPWLMGPTTPTLATPLVEGNLPLPPATPKPSLMKASKVDRIWMTKRKELG